MTGVLVMIVNSVIPRSYWRSALALIQSWSPVVAPARATLR